MTSAAPLVMLVAHRLADPTASGVGRYVRSISTALATATDPALARYAIAASAEPDPITWTPDSLACHQIPGSRKLLNLRWSLGPWPRLEGLIPRPDVVHALEAFAPIRSGLPRVWTVHDIMPITHPAWYPPRHRYLARRALDLIRRSPDLVITVSAAVERDLLAQGIDPARIRVIHHGVDDRFRATPTPTVVETVCAEHGVTRGTFLLAVGGISTRKNLTVLAHALERVPPTRATPELLVTGPSRHGATEVLDRLARLGDRVRVTGYLPDADVVVLMHAALALVHPSRDEGFGLVPLEAMAAGAPVLASRSGSVPEAMGSAGILLDPDDADGWAEAIERIRENDVHRDSLARAGVAHAARFTWERAATATQAVHLETLERSSHA